MLSGWIVGFQDVFIELTNESRHLLGHFIELFLQVFGYSGEMESAFKLCAVILIIVLK